MVGLKNSSCFVLKKETFQMDKRPCFIKDKLILIISPILFETAVLIQFFY